MIKINDFRIKKTTHQFPYMVASRGRVICRCRSLRVAIGNVIMMLNSTLW